MLRCDQAALKPIQLVADTTCFFLFATLNFNIYRSPTVLVIRYSAKNTKKLYYWLIQYKRQLYLCWKRNLILFFSCLSSSGNVLWSRHGNSFVAYSQCRKYRPKVMLSVTLATSILRCRWRRLITIPMSPSSEAVACCRSTCWALMMLRSTPVSISILTYLLST